IGGLILRDDNQKPIFAQIYFYDELLKNNLFVEQFVTSEAKVKISEIAVLLYNYNIQLKYQDIVIQTHERHLKNISELNGAYDLE
ncbi:8186_t:CDS:2, partial [Funneliformis mosseae]